MDSSAPVATIDAAEAVELPTRSELAKWSLKRFIIAAWHVIEPGRTLAWSWYHDAICDHLEALTFGGKNAAGEPIDFRKLAIVVPPNTLKSRIIACAWTAWAWLHNPGWRWLFVSGAENNAERDALACRRIVESEWYQTTFKPDWALAADKNTAAWYDTTAGGHRQSLPVGGKFTGRKADFIVIDDANDAMKVTSEADREHVNRTFDDAIYDRWVDPGTVRHVVVGQRTHTHDLIGHILEKYGWELLYIPEEFRPHKRCRTAIGFCDPRTARDELLRPVGMQALTRKQVDDFKRVNKTKFDTAFNGEPKDRTGKLFKAKNLRYWHREGDWFVLPNPAGGERRFHKNAVLHRFGAADGAASSTTTSDYTVISSFYVTPDHDLLWVGCRRVQAEIPDQPAMLQEEYDKFGLEWVGIEAVASNAALLQIAKRTRMNATKYDPQQKDKKARATPAVIFTENHRLWLPGPEVTAATADAADPSNDFPTDDVVTELTEFSGEKGMDTHDDIVDTLAYAVIWLTTFYPESAPRPSDQVGVGGVIGFDNPKNVLHPQPMQTPTLNRRREEQNEGGIYYPPYNPDV